jgi:hypothetical protein
VRELPNIFGHFRPEAPLVKLKFQKSKKNTIYPHQIQQKNTTFAE